MQWWALVVVIATLAGLFQDIVKPVFKNNSIQNQELISLLKHRKETVDTLYKQISKEIDFIENDTSLQQFKIDLLDYKKRLHLAKVEFNQLYDKNIQALNNNQLIMSHELATEIHNISRKHDLDRLGQVITPEDIDILKHLIELNESLLTMLSMSCLGCDASMLIDSQQKLIREILIKKRILELQNVQVDLSPIEELLHGYKINPSNHQGERPHRNNWLLQMEDYLDSMKSDTIPRK